MPLSDFATIAITTRNPGLTLAGFGTDLIPSATAAWVERTRTYNGIAGVLGDFAVTTAEYQAANALFAQPIAPPALMIGRLANKPSQVFTIAIATVVSVAGTPYKVRVNDLSAGSSGANVGVTAAFTTVGADTNDSIIAGIVAAINGLAVANVSAASTGSVGSKICTITVAVAGKFVGIEVMDISLGAVGGLMLLTETTADPGITADLTAINAESSVWYGLTPLFASAAILAAAAAFVESNTKLMIAASADSVVATQALGVGTDIAQTLKAASRLRTSVFFHPRNDEWAHVAEVGVFFPKNPGSETWRTKPLSGVTAAAITATQETNLKAKFCQFYYAVSGPGTANAISVVGGDAKVAFGEYIDVVRFRDWVAATMGTNLFNLQLNVDKIPNTDPGINSVENICRQVLQQGIARGGIVAGSDTYSFPTAASEPTADRAARVLNLANCGFQLAGAIHLINVSVAVSN
jgi:hypothetical protein